MAKPTAKASLFALLLKLGLERGEFGEGRIWIGLALATFGRGKRTTGARVARFALALASTHSVHVLLSMNQDLWDTSFGQQLPSALEDRLSARSVPLRGLSVSDAESLVLMRLRASGATESEGNAFLRFIDLERAATLARPEVAKLIDEK